MPWTLVSVAGQQARKQKVGGEMEVTLSGDAKAKQMEMVTYLSS